MSIAIKKSLVMALAITSIIYFLQTNESKVQESTLADETSSVTRSIASSTSRSTEIFNFEKIAKVIFDLGGKEVEQKFKGHLFMQWQKGTENHRDALVMMTMPEHKINFAVKAHFTKDYSLGCIELPEKLSESEEEYALLFQSLLLDYAFKSTRDENGEYTSNIQQVKSSRGVTRLLKRKQEYLNNKRKFLHIDKSDHIISLDDSLKKILGEERYSLLIPFEKGEEVTVSTRISYKLSRMDGKWPSLPQVDTERRFGSCNRDFIKQKAKVSSMDPSSLKDILLTLRELDRKGRQKQMRKILLALKARPELLASFMEWAKTVLSDRKLSAFAIGVLGSLGTPAAQNELIGIFGLATNDTSYLQNQVLNSFALMKSSLSSSARGFLKQQINGQDFRLEEGAAYALGSSIANDSSGVSAQEDLNYLVGALGSAESIKEKMVYLDALGNAGSETTLNTLEKYTNDSSSLVRAKAITSLRSITSENVVSIYTNALKDSSRHVRKAAWNNIKSSISTGNYSSILSNCSSVTTDESIQQECLSYN